jgi:hypothetical protein
MMSGPKRNPDKLNTIGVVVVGICGAVLVYVSIVALQAFYMNDTSEVQTMADYGGQDTAHQSLRATQANVIEDCGPNSKPEAGKQQTYRIPIKYAIKLVADGAKVDPSNLVPTQGRSDKATILPIFGRPKVTPAATPAGGGSAAPATGDVPMPPTGGQGPGGGQPPGQGPTPGTGAGGPPSGTGAADPNPTGAQTPSPGGAASGGASGDAKRPGGGAVENKDINKAGSASPGGNPPTPAPKAGASDPKAGTAPPKAGAGSAPAPKAPAPKAGSAAKGSAN